MYVHHLSVTYAGQFVSVKSSGEKKETGKKWEVKKKPLEIELMNNNFFIKGNFPDLLLWSIYHCKNVFSDQIAHSNVNHTYTC